MERTDGKDGTTRTESGVKKPKMREGIGSNKDIEGKKAPVISKVVMATNST